MLSAIYQLALVIAMGVLAILLIRGYTLLTAIYRSGMVLVIVLFLLIIAGNILRWSIYAKQMPVEDEGQTPEPEAENEISDSDRE